jgi:VIT1/CCC1 family predicted Fe2+/Mn2+ transporter
VLGANDGIISVASLVVGVAASGATAHSVLLTGVAGLVAGTVAMAAGEYVSVQSQADTENADIRLERRSLEDHPDSELNELTAIYVGRGLDEGLARTVAEALTGSDAIGAHSRDELGITESLRARPLQAALASALSFSAGAVVPVAVALLTPVARVAVVASMTALVSLLVLGGAAARVGGASVWRGAIRVGFWGALAMALTAGVGRLFGAHA